MMKKRISIVKLIESQSSLDRLIIENNCVKIRPGNEAEFTTGLLQLLKLHHAGFEFDAVYIRAEGQADQVEAVERMKQKIVKALTGKGTLSLKRLEDFCHVRRGGSGGHEAFNRAVRALTSSQEVTVVGKTQRGQPFYALGNGKEQDGHRI
jgi:hypothetical protein